MAESTWTNQEGLLDDAPPNRMKFVIGGKAMSRPLSRALPSYSAFPT